MDQPSARSRDPLAAAPAVPPQAAPKKRRRWGRRLLILGLVLVGLVALSPLALSLPPVRNFLASKASEAVGKKVTIAGASAFWGKGVTLEGIVVESGAGFDGPLATVERVHATMDLLALLSGTVRATCEITRPDVSFRKDAAGRSNAEGLFPDQGEKEPEKKESTTSFDVSLTVTDGAIRSPAEGGKPGEAVTGINATVKMDPSGDMEATLAALAKGARPGGGDAPLSASVRLVKRGDGPMKVEIPEIDLARLSGLVEGMTGTTISGRLTTTVDGATRPGPGMDGKVRVVLADFAARRPDGTTVSLGRLEGTAALVKDGDATTADLTLSGAQVTLVTGSGADAERFDEPKVDVTAKARYDGTTGVLVVNAARVTAGQALTIDVKRAVEMKDGSVSGAADVHADLARLSAVIEKMSGWRVRGTLDTSFDGAMRSAEDLEGKMTLTAKGLLAEDGKGSRYGADQVDATADVTGASEATSANVSVTLRNVVATSTTAEGEKSLREPEVKIVGKARLGNDQTTQVDEATITVGQALAVKTSKPWTISGSGATTKATGGATFRADLARLTALRTFAPALDQFTAGVIDGSLEATPSSGLSVGASVQVRGLVIKPGDIAPDGYTESDALVRVRFVQPTGGDPMVQVYDVRTSIVQIPLDPQKRTLDVTMGSAVSFAGPVHVVVNLENLSRAFGGSMGLAKGERLGGTIQLDGSGSGTAESGGLEVKLAGRNLVFPPSWGAAGPPANLDGTLALALRKAGMDVKVTGLKGVGLDLAADAAMATGEGGGLETASVTGTIDLGQARPWLEPFAKLGKDALLTGIVTLNTRITPEKGGRRAKGTVGVKTLKYRADAKGGVLDEPSLTLEHDVFLPPKGGRYAFDALRLKASSVAAEITGGAQEVGDAMEVDAALSLSGDSAKLGAQVRAFLGSESDLVGSGTLTGKITVKGGTAKGGRTLLVNGDVDPGRWATGGFTIDRARLSLRRPALKDPLAITLDAGVNTGTAGVYANLDMNRDGNPWGGRVTLKTVDMSPVVMDKGPGQYLAFVLPAVLPANSAMPVLSGRLDADIQMVAASTESPRMEETMRGEGYVLMSQGAVKESTLFKSLGGGGLGDAGKVLATAVPEVGREIEGLMKIAAFSRLESQFSVLNRVVTVKTARLDSERTSVQMKGTVTFDEQANLEANLVFSGSLGDALGRVLPSKTIPMRIQGPLEKPRITPNLSTKDLLQAGLAGQLPGGLPKIDPKDPLKGLKDILPK